MGFRHQLSVYSPVGLHAIASAITGAVGFRNDARAHVCSLLQRDLAADTCVLTDSGTHALQMAIMFARNNEGSSAPVAIPAFSCYDIATAVIGAGVEVLLYDLDPNSLSPNITSLETTLRKGARTVVIAPLYGIPVDWDALQQLAISYGATLIEDAAQGLGASWRGHALGGLGRVSIVSFGRGKGWTGGRGGAILFREPRGVSGHVWNTPAPSEFSTVAGLIVQELLGRPSVYGIPRSIPALHLGETTFVPPTGPSAIPLSSAAALLATRKRSELESIIRRENAARLLHDIVETGRLKKINVPDGGIAGYLRLPLRVTGGMTAFELPRRAVALGLAQSYPISLADLGPLQSHLVSNTGELPGARLLARDLITVPTHSKVTHNDRQNILEMLRAVGATR